MESGAQYESSSDTNYGKDYEDIFDQDTTASNSDFAARLEYQSSESDETVYGDDKGFQEACQLADGLLLENPLPDKTSDTASMLEFDMMRSSPPAE